MPEWACQMDHGKLGELIGACNQRAGPGGMLSADDWQAIMERFCINTSGLDEFLVWLYHLGRSPADVPPLPQADVHDGALSGMDLDRPPGPGSYYGRAWHLAASHEAAQAAKSTRGKGPNQGTSRVTDKEQMHMEKRQLLANEGFKAFHAGCEAALRHGKHMGCPPEYRNVLHAWE